MTLKISVLASGEVLLDGKPVGMEALDIELQTAKGQNGAVWYHRESSGKEAPPQAKAVIDLVIKHRLPISLSSKPDFSDYVDAKGVSHPRAAQSAPRMPEVVAPANIEEVFASIRKIAAGDKGQGGVVILRPNRRYLQVPPMQATPDLKKFADGLAKLIPPGIQRNIAVVSYTEFGGDASAPSVTEVDKSIPFFGLLMGLGYLGHAVWVFEGHPSAFAAGCRDADALIVDSGMLPFLQKDWQDVAAGVMRNANILVHNRANFQLLIARKVGESASRLEFADQPARS